MWPSYRKPVLFPLTYVIFCLGTATFNVEPIIVLTEIFRWHFFGKKSSCVVRQSFVLCVIKEGRERFWLYLEEVLEDLRSFLNSPPNYDQPYLVL